MKVLSPPSVMVLPVMETIRLLCMVSSRTAQTEPRAPFHSLMFTLMPLLVETLLAVKVYGDGFSAEEVAHFAFPCADGSVSYAHHSGILISVVLVLTAAYRQDADNGDGKNR